MDPALLAAIQAVVPDATALPGYDAKAAEQVLVLRAGVLGWKTTLAAPASPAPTASQASASPAAVEQAPAASPALTIAGKTALGPTENSTTLTSSVVGEWSLPTPNGASLWPGRPRNGTMATINDIKAGGCTVQFKSAAGDTATITITK